MFLYRGGQVTAYTGAPIPASLPVGLTPHDGTLPDGLPVDAGMRWLVDFAEAVKVGMGLPIPLTPADLKAGFDRIVVFGVRDGKQDGPGNAQFASAARRAPLHRRPRLRAAGHADQQHAATRPPAYSRSDPDYAISFAVERERAADRRPGRGRPGWPPGCSACPAQVFDHVRYADGHGVAQRRATCSPRSGRPPSATSWTR